MKSRTPERAAFIENLNLQTEPETSEVAWPAVIGFFVLIFVAALGGRLDILAGPFSRPIETVRSIESRMAEVMTVPAATLLPSASTSMKGLDLHPDLLYQPYLGGEAIASRGNETSSAIGRFQAFLDQYVQRQAIDDNFTVRLIDDRTGETLELGSLEGARRKYQQSGSADWEAVDRLRRHETSRLIGKYLKKGYPRAALVSRWGRSNQVLEAREREQAFIDYEVRLARYLGLSLLSTEIGTVETFNQDRLVSTVGARSRYQMMPYVLRQNGVAQYTLSTTGGGSVPVIEEWHPLLTMEPALLTLKGYANAVGHEIPGISAYHTGPGNILNLYQQYLVNNPVRANEGATVMDAYMWAVTDGFPLVSSRSSFKGYSRGYVATAYGSLRATEKLPLERGAAVRGERVQLRAGVRLPLSRLVAQLERAPLAGLEPGESVYRAMVRLNPHLSLEPSASSVPVSSDVVFVSEAEGVPVRFFVPSGGASALGQDVVEEVFRYDASTYAVLGAREEDRQYAQLVEEAGRFGFTEKARAELMRLRGRFEELAQQEPSHFRKAQLTVIQAHAQIWNTRSFERLAETLAAVRGTHEVNTGVIQ